MMKKRHILHWAMGVVMTPLLGSCAFDELHEIAGGGNGVLSFEVGVEQLHDSQGWTRASGPQMRPMHSLELVSAQGDTIYARSQSLGIIKEHSNVSPATRATAKTADTFYESFGVIAFNYANTLSWDDVKSEATPSVYNAKASQSGVKWVVGSNNYWPGPSKKVSFFAYAPFSDNNSGIALSDQTANGVPTITYTVPSTAADQSDLLVATALDQDGSGTSSPALSFSHALCGVKFAVGSMEGITNITKIIISGVNNKGTLEIGGAWNVDNSSTSNYTIDKTSNPISVSGISNLDITSGDDLLFLMPQEVPSGATLTITADGKEYSTTIAGESWAMGAMVTYKLSINKITGKYEFNVTSTDVAQDAITADITVTSYFEYNDGSSTQQKAIKWKVENYGADYSIGGSDTEISRPVTLSFSANNATSGQDATLQAKSEVGSESSPVDLSIRTKDGNQVRETANCYVVNAPGWYMFPLVYGNGIKSDSKNYENNLTGFKGSVFTTHESTMKMSSLTSPWINDNYTVSSCELLWQDAENLIEYDSYKIVDVDEKKYMKFHISSSNIKQGNAVLAVKNSSQILWSWHIWVTALDVYSTQAVTSSFGGSPHTLNFMPVPLGWYSATETVNPKTNTLSVKQEGSGKTANGTVTQAGETGSATVGTCTFYQWGRKDPFPPSDGTSVNSKIDKTLYTYGTRGISTTSNCWSRSYSQATIATSILNPSTFYYGSANWCNQSSNELWNVGEDDYNVVFETIKKSVYDPSPAGFRLPETAAFTGFTQDGENGRTPYGSWESSTCGFKFTTGSVTTYWQACGYLAYDSGSLLSVGFDGDYWSAGPSNATDGCGLTFNSGSVYPQSTHYRAYGFSVRPVSE